MQTKCCSTLKLCSGSFAFLFLTNDPLFVYKILHTFVCPVWKPNIDKINLILGIVMHTKKKVRGSLYIILLHLLHFFYRPEYTIYNDW